MHCTNPRTRNLRGTGPPTPARPAIIPDNLLARHKYGGGAWEGTRSEGNPLHGPRENVHPGLRRGARRRGAEGARRPREREPRDDEDIRHLLDSVPQREGGLEGPVHLPRG